jgi:hypothetical protein
MKNYQLFNKIYNIGFLKNWEFIDNLISNKGLSKENIIDKLAQRRESFYIPNLKPYEEIERKWLLSNFGKENFDSWFKEGMSTPGDSIYVIQSYLYEEPEIRIRKVTIETTDKKFPQNKRITYFLDTKEATNDKKKRITLHEIITKAQYEKSFKKALGTCEKWFMPYYKNMYQLSKIKVKNKPILYNAEIEFDSMIESKTFVPDQEICLKEVTDDESYSKERLKMISDAMVLQNTKRENGSSYHFQFSASAASVYIRFISSFISSKLNKPLLCNTFCTVIPRSERMALLKKPMISSTVRIL